MARKNISDLQLAVIRAIVAGKTFAQIEEELGVPLRTAKRWKSQFSALLAEGDSAIVEMLLESRVQSIGLLNAALDELQRLLRTAEEPQDKLSAIDRIFRAFQLLNPPTSPASVTVSPSEENHGRVIVQLPDNQRG